LRVRLDAAVNHGWLEPMLPAQADALRDREPCRQEPDLLLAHRSSSI
jgi:hypothetical protein